MANRVVHFEIPATNKKRASDFYTKAFGWKMEDMGANYGGYVVASSGPSMPDSNPANLGINGGIYEIKKKDVNAYRCVIGVEDIEKAMKDVKSSGGKIITEKPDDIPGVGIFAKCEDTEGNIFSLLQPSPDMMPKK